MSYLSQKREQGRHDEVRTEGPEACKPGAPRAYGLRVNLFVCLSIHKISRYPIKWDDSRRVFPKCVLYLPQMQTHEDKFFLKYCQSAVSILQLTFTEKCQLEI